MGQGKLEPGYSIHEKTIAHWEWRDGESGTYPPGKGSPKRGLCALGWRGPVHVVEDPWERLTYARVKCYICRVVRDPQLSKSIRIAVISPESGDLISDLQPKSGCKHYE